MGESAYYAKSLKKFQNGQCEYHFSTSVSTILAPKKRPVEALRPHWSLLCSQIPCVEGRRSIRMREQEGQIGNSCSVRKYGCWRLTGGGGKQRIDGQFPSGRVPRP
jgi:hypothetical protein